MNRVYFVRHGENRANLTKEFSVRHVNYPLNEKGRLQAEQTAQALAATPFDAAFASPLLRTVQTAEIIARPHGLSVQAMEQFREVDVGRLELLPTSAEVWQTHNRIFHRWAGGESGLGFPEGETLAMLWARFENGLSQVLGRQDGRTLLVAGHGGLFTAAMGHICENFSFQQAMATSNPNCSISIVDFEPGFPARRGHLLQWASSAHLHGPAAELVSGAWDPATGRGAPTLRSQPPTPATD